MNKLLIALDAGHSTYNTAGKRTPNFTDGTKSKETNENFMHENEFNRATMNKLITILQCCGFNTLTVSDPTGKIDTPLSERTSKANTAKADLYVSIHANASKGVWGTWGGVDTFYYKTVAKSKELATIVQKHLVAATGLRDRGASLQNFHVIRETKMPSILCECGFMDNLNEAKLLLSDDYRQKVAEAIAKGICEYFNVEYIAEEIKKDTKKYKVQVGSFGVKANAENLKAKLVKLGFKAIIVES